jgi:nucleoid DNA-binding protein
MAKIADDAQARSGSKVQMVSLDEMRRQRQTTRGHGIMTLNKNKMVREIGRRTRLPNRDVQRVVETLVDVWTEALVAGERIELENFLVLEVKAIDRGEQAGTLSSGKAPRVIRRVVVKASKRLKRLLNR